CGPGFQLTTTFTSLTVRNALRERPRVILTTHVNFAKAAYWLKKLSKGRYGAVAHGVGVWAMHDRRCARPLRSADRLVAVSNFTRDRLAQQIGLGIGKIG